MILYDENIFMFYKVCVCVCVYTTSFTLGGKEKMMRLMGLLFWVELGILTIIMVKNSDSETCKAGFLSQLCH